MSRKKRIPTFRQLCSWLRQCVALIQGVRVEKHSSQTFFFKTVFPDFLSWNSVFFTPVSLWHPDKVNRDTVGILFLLNTSVSRKPQTVLHETVLNIALLSVNSEISGSVECVRVPHRWMRIFVCAALSINDLVYGRRRPWILFWNMMPNAVRLRLHHSLLQRSRITISHKLTPQFRTCVLRLELNKKKKQGPPWQERWTCCIENEKLFESARLFPFL